MKRMYKTNINMPYNRGGYERAVFIFGHSGLQTHGRRVLNVDVPNAMCVVNLNDVGDIATYGQLECFYDFTLFADASVLLDPLTHKTEIERNVNMRIHAMRHEYGLGPTTLRDIRLTFTVEHQETTDMVYEMSSNINDDTYALAGIHEMGLLKQNWSQFKPVLGQKSPVACSDIQRCYRSSVWPTPADVAEACGVRTSQTVNEWAECVRSNFEMTTKQAFETIRRMGMRSCIVYNMGCRSGDVEGPQTRLTFQVDRKRSNDNQGALHARIPSAVPTLGSEHVDDSTCDDPRGCTLAGGQLSGVHGLSPGRGWKRSPNRKRGVRSPNSSKRG